jgi:2-desacetyl-2-hydroxyethyl bacteriochlorophyllide A dehydrogenase
LLRIPDGVDYGTAILAEPVAVGIHALSLSNPPFNAAVLVLGAGPIGMISAMLARDSGCRVVMADPSPVRRAKAADFGFAAFDNSAVSPSAAADRYAGGAGFDAFFECAGHAGTIDYMIKSGRPGSEIVLVGTFKDPPAVDFFMMSRKEQKVYPSWTYRIADCASALDLLARSGAGYSKLISHQFPLERAGEAIDLVMRGEDSLKVVLTL